MAGAASVGAAVIVTAAVVTGGHARPHHHAGSSTTAVYEVAARTASTHTAGPHTSAPHRGGKYRPERWHLAAAGHHRRVHRDHGQCPAPHLRRWICEAEDIMVQHGTPKSAISSGAALIVVRHESGGNPRAHNGWDSNAAEGNPSEGITQVTSQTFRAYALPGHGNIWNPVDNMIASFRYAIARYGSMNHIPGVVTVRGGSAYIGY